MKLLAVDSSQVRAVVCLLELSDEKAELLEARVASVSVAASESLLPLLDDVLNAQDLSLNDIDAFACGVGPGSFTGIRIGLATVKTLSQTLSKPVVSVSSLRALGLSLAGNVPVVAVANAYQGQVFIGWQSIKSGGAWRETAQPLIEWATTEMIDCAPDTMIVGPGADQYATDLIKAELGSQYCKQIELTPQGLFRAVYETICARGGAALGTFIDVEPSYIRPAQAVLNLAAARLKG